MNGSIQTTPLYAISFNQEEAVWLQTYMQNQKDSIELPGDTEFRENLYNLLSKLISK